MSVEIRMGRRRKTRMLVGELVSRGLNLEMEGEEIELDNLFWLQGLKDKNEEEFVEEEEEEREMNVKDMASFSL